MDGPHNQTRNQRWQEQTQGDQSAPDESRPKQQPSTSPRGEAAGQAEKEASERAGLDSDAQVAEVRARMDASEHARRDGYVAQPGPHAGYEPDPNKPDNAGEHEAARAAAGFAPGEQVVTEEAEPEGMAVEEEGDETAPADAAVTETNAPDHRLFAAPPPDAPAPAPFPELAPKGKKGK